MDVVTLGYTCVCGERVEVVKLKQNQPYLIPRLVSVSCSKGHNATFSRGQIGYLEVLTTGSGTALSETSGREVRKAA